MTTQLREAIARLRSANLYKFADVMLVCDALEVQLNKPRFDKVAYMREYMKKRRANAKKQLTSC